MRESNGVFLGGDARSGTTLLIDLIGLHPRLSPIYETNFLVRIANLLTKYGWLARIHGPNRIREIMEDACTLLPSSRHTEPRGTGETFLHGPNHVLLEPEFVMAQTARLETTVRWGGHNQALNDFIITLFDEHCQADNKPRWVNKTPRNINVLPRLHAATPGMKFIHSVRDGRDVVCSNMRRVITQHTGRRVLLDKRHPPGPRIRAKVWRPVPRSQIREPAHRSRRRTEPGVQLVG